MVKRNYIPISTVRQRAANRSSTTVSEGSLIAEFNSAISAIEKENVDESTLINRFIKECMATDRANQYIKECLDLVNETAGLPYHDKLVSDINEFVLPKVKDLNRASVLVEDTDDFVARTKFQDTLASLKDCDRLLDNYNLIGGRFNLDSYKKKYDIAKLPSKKDDDAYSAVAEDFSFLMDTYAMPLRKKFAIALESSIYMNTLYGDPSKNPDIVRGVTEYYMMNNDVIADRDYNAIIKILETNSFIDNEDLKDVTYMFNNKNKLFSERILEASADSKLNKQYKELLAKIAGCKTLAVAKGLIKAAVTLIFSTFVIAAVVPFSIVVILLCALYGLILTIAISPAVFVSTIKEEIKAGEDMVAAYSSTDKREVISRSNKVYKFVRNINTNLTGGDALREAANLFDKYIPQTGVDAPILKDTDDYRFMSINDVSSVLEHTDMDSADIKTLLDQYKAEQNKTMPKFKKIITKFFTRRPADIIDGIPHILSFIRSGLILSTFAVPVVGPAIGIIWFIVDKLIEFSIKRDEAERVLKYFRSERDKAENKYNSMKDGDKKDDMTTYLNALDKAIDNLEEYRDSLYTDKELDKQMELDEATMNICEKIPLNEFIRLYFAPLCSNISKAVQLIRNEVIRKADSICVYDEYQIGNEDISKVFSKVSPQELLSFYTTPDGLVDVPLGKILNCNPDCDKSYSVSVDICSTINRYIDKDFTVTSYRIGSSVALILNCFQAISVDDIAGFRTDSFAESASMIMKEILYNTAVVEDIVDLQPQNFVNEMISNIDIILQEDKEDLCDLCDNINKCGLDTMGLHTYLKDYMSTLPVTDTATGSKLDLMCSNIESEPNDEEKSDTTQFTYMDSLNSLNFVNSVIEEANAKKEAVKTKDSKEKGVSIIKKAKEKLAKSKEGKTPMKTTIALAGKAASNKVKDITSKEKELSRTIDAYSGTILKSCKDALTSNRREAIIKGSIIPSFSKMIKGAAAVGVVGAIGGTTAAAITAIGALATSKILTKRERDMILEEIEIEEEVVAKQIEACDTSDAKKYKALLMYQRKLQRESQRIRFNIKAYGRNAPDPTE